MAIIKTLRFDMLTIDSEFYFEGAETAVWRKISAARAEPVPTGTGRPIRIRNSELVCVPVPEPTPDTPEQIAEKRRRRFERQVERFMTYGQTDLDTFNSYMLINPLHAFEYARNAIRAVVMREVGSWMQRIYESAEGGVDAAIQEARERAMQSARSPKRSTDPISNYLSQELGSAYAEFVEGF